MPGPTSNRGGDYQRYTLGVAIFILLLSIGPLRHHLILRGAPVHFISWLDDRVHISVDDLSQAATAAGISPLPDYACAISEPKMPPSEAEAMTRK